MSCVHYNVLVLYILLRYYVRILPDTSYNIYCNMIAAVLVHKYCTYDVRDVNPNPDPKPINNRIPVSYIGCMIA